MDIVEVFSQAMRDPLPAADYRPEGLRVLVVEDDVADAYLIECALSADPRIGAITHVTDGVEAIQAMERGEVAPDIAIIDLQMPRMDGFRLLVELRCRREHTFPMIVLTSSTARADLVRGKLRGADLVLAKPDTLSQLKDVLHKAIGDL